LICGHDRRKGEGPTTYPVACSPQAWSVSAVFMLLDALLQIEIDPVRKEVRFQNPYLPDYLESIMIKELQVTTHLATLEIQRQQNNNQVSVYWANQPDDWKLILVR
jgi:glycogen debranching enzyme